METPQQERLRYYIEKCGLSVKQFEKKCGISNGSVANTKLGLSTTLEKISVANPDLNMYWLLTGEGTMLKSESDYYPEQTDQDLIPLVDVVALAGTLTNAVDGRTLAQLDRTASPVAGADIALEVYGDSMEPEYPSGSRVFCRRVQADTPIIWGNVYVLDTADGVLIKELQHTDDDGVLLCRSLNPNGRYAPFTYPRKRIYNIWRVLGVFILKG